MLGRRRPLAAVCVGFVIFVAARAITALSDEPKSSGARGRSAAASKESPTIQGIEPTRLAERKFLLAAVSPDGTRLLTLSTGFQLQLWDLASGAALRRDFTQPTAEQTTAFAWSADGRLVAAGSVTPEGLFTISAHVTVWDAATGRRVQRCEVKAPKVLAAYYVNHVQFTPDAKRIFALLEAGDSSARIWDVATGRELLKINGLSDAEDGAMLSADGRRIFVSNGRLGMGPSVVRDAGTGKEVCRFDPNGESILACSAISADGTRVATAAYQGQHVVNIWDAANGRKLRTLSGHTDEINSVAFTTDGRRVVTGSNDSTARVWNASTGGEISCLTRAKPVLSAAPSADGLRVQVQWYVGDAGDSGFPRHSIWTPETGHVNEVPGGAEVLGFEPDSRWYLVIEGGYPTKESPNNPAPTVATLYDTATGKAVRTYK